jgi:hypothetical protein
MKTSKWIMIFILCLLVAAAYGQVKTKKPNITVTSPNGGESWSPGSTYKIRWTRYNTSGTLRIQLVKPKNQILTIHTTRASGTGLRMGSYEWTIPQDMAQSSKYKMRIQIHTAGKIISDSSDDEFAIRQTINKQMRTEIRIPYTTVLYPNGGETIRKGRSCRIRWKSNQDFSGARIKILQGISELHIYNITPEGPFNEDEYAWNWAVPADIPNSDDYKVRVEGPVSDQSNNNFTVTDKHIEIYSPRAGDIWYKTQNHMITYRCENIRQNIKIRYSQAIDPLADDYSPTTGEYMWVNVGEIHGAIYPGGTGRIIIETMDGTVRAQTRNFTVQTPEIDVTSPVGGALVNIASDLTIRWSAPHLSGRVKIELYRAPLAGGDFTRHSTIIASTANDGVFTWRVDATANMRYKFRISSVLQSDIFGESGVWRFRLKL